MSSRILGHGQTAEVVTLAWRHVGAPVAADDAVDAAGTPQTRGTANGPTWEQYHALESRLRESEQQAPQREQLAWKQGEAAANGRWEAALEKLSRSIAEIAGFRPRLRKEAECDVVKLSLAIARRILRRELTVDPDALVGIVRSAFDRLGAREVHRVRVRPEDTAVITAYLERIGTPQRIEVLGDPGLERGGVIVETQRGNLDVSLDTQVEEIERGFTDLLERRTSP